MAQSVLRCPQCNKPFDHESSLKRHGYYCRSRKFGNVPRPRSCTCCARKKARCDNKRPQCSRCASKGLECHYPANSSRKPRTSGLHQAGGGGLANDQVSPPSWPADAVRVGGIPEGDSIVPVSSDSDLSVPDIDFAEIWGDSLDLKGRDTDFMGLLGPPDDLTIDPSFLEAPPSLAQQPTARTSDHVVPRRPSFLPPYQPVPPTPTGVVRSLARRPGPPPKAQRPASLVFHILKSYPLMMLRHDTLPPFIHPSFLTSRIVDRDDMEPLINCISVMRMISAGFAGSRKLFWKTVRLECERICDEHLAFNRWELLAAMQAVAMYILIRLDEGETEYNNFDPLFVRSVITLSNRFNSSEIMHPPNASASQEVEWKDWLFEESKRRLCVIYQVLNLLIYFEPADMCKLQPELVLAPLPAKKQLWEAGSEHHWRAELEREPDAFAAFGLAATGELVQLESAEKGVPGDRFPLSTPKAMRLSGTPANWEQWCSGMDGFGGLVMLTASLVA
ncbi:hypothetical protein VTK73DRAFT_9547 [Phialemonium thermophilum]|uniref:Zn(2)-C6 fungal-type domain-containing protein n=1 Tax=Phialemonium thermophilum TaxID=223376 RepID=A0ABR3W1Z6_9PEZI